MISTIMRSLSLFLALLVGLAMPVWAQTPVLRSSQNLRPVPPVARAEVAPPRAEAVARRAAPELPYIQPPPSNGGDLGTATLRAGDTFEMRLSGMEAPYGEEFSRQYLVDANGTVNFPYIKDVRADGYTPGALERIVQQKLVAAKIFTNPTVNITMQTTARVVAVTGGVRSPQRLPWTPNLTLRTAVNLCGGVGDFGNGKGVRHIRDGRLLNTYDLKKLQKDLSLDPKLLPGDQVDVPE